MLPAAASPDLVLRPGGAADRCRAAADPAPAERRAGRVALCYEPHLDGLFTYCLSVMYEHGAATAALGDALVHAERHYPLLRDPGLVRAWLYALARFACLRRLAAAGGRRPAVLAPGREHGTDAGRRADLAALGWPEAVGIPSDQREALELAVRHGLGPREIAAVLGLEPAPARALLARAAREVERTRGALAVAEAGGCPALERVADSPRALLGSTLRGELVAHVDTCPCCRATSGALRAAYPWAGGTPEVLRLVRAPRAALFTAMADAARAGGIPPVAPWAAGRRRPAPVPALRFDRRGFPVAGRPRRGAASGRARPVPLPPAGYRTSEYGAAEYPAADYEAAGYRAAEYGSAAYRPSRTRRGPDGYPDDHAPDGYPDDRFPDGHLPGAHPPLGGRPRDRRGGLRQRAVTAGVVVTAVAVPLVALWAAYQGGQQATSHDPAASSSDDGSGAPRTGRGGSRAEGSRGTAALPAPTGNDASADSRGSPEATASQGAREPGPEKSPKPSRPGRAAASRSRAASPPPAAPGTLSVSAGPQQGRLTEVTLRASGGPVRWSAAASREWLLLSRASGELAPGESLVVRVSVDEAREPSGPWQGSVTFAPSGRVVTVRGTGPSASPSPGGTPSGGTDRSAPPPDGTGTGERGDAGDRAASAAL